MSRMLASVCNTDEARMVLEAGVDIVDLKDPGNGALGALDTGIISRIVALVDGLVPVSATIGDLPFEAARIEPAMRRMASTGVDIIKIGVFGRHDRRETLRLLRESCQQGLRIVLVMFAEYYTEDINLDDLAATGITGIMLDTMNKETGSLRDKLPGSVLGTFVSRAADRGMLSGLAGSLRQDDIPPLLALGPDYLGFRGGLCRRGRRDQVMDKEALMGVRGKIQRFNGDRAPATTII